MIKYELNKTDRARRWKIAFIISTVLIAFVAFLAQPKAADNGGYVRGQYGQHCYARGDQPKSITHPLYFNTREECQRSLD